jgi:hypothetical protein
MSAYFLVADRLPILLYSMSVRQGRPSIWFHSINLNVISYITAFHCCRGERIQGSVGGYRMQTWFKYSFHDGPGILFFVLTECKAYMDFVKTMYRRACECVSVRARVHARACMSNTCCLGNGQNPVFPTSLALQCVWKSGQLQGSPSLAKTCKTLRTFGVWLWANCFGPGGHKSFGILEGELSFSVVNLHSLVLAAHEIGPPLKFWCSLNVPALKHRIRLL